MLVYSVECFIHHLHVFLDSQILGMQLNDVFHVCNPSIFRKYILQVKLLVHLFELILFNHVPKRQNNFVDNITNNILDWNLSHA